MTGFSTFITASLLLISCTAAKSTSVIGSDSNETNHTVPADTVTIAPLEKYNVTIEITEHIPYCGGAAPGPDQLNNYVNYGGELIITNIEDQTTRSIIPNNGIYYTFLPVGKYTIKEKYKDIPFTEFVKNNERTGMYYMEGSEECYKKWWKSNLFEFEITNEAEVLELNTSIGSSCFTGNNPCIQYTGPYPP